MTRSFINSIERLPSGIILVAAAVLVFLLLGLVVLISLLLERNAEPQQVLTGQPTLNPPRHIPVRCRECAP